MRDFSDHGLTPDVREYLAQLALASEENTDIGETLDRIEQRLAAQRISNPALRDAARILKSNIARWGAAHAQLARLAMDFALSYEDDACSMVE